MNIRPTQPEGPKQGGPDRLADRAVTPPARRGASPEAGSPGAMPLDQVRISEEVRSLQGKHGAEAIPAGELSPARLRQVLDRIQHGYYRRPEVVRDTLRALSPALESAGDEN